VTRAAIREESGLCITGGGGGAGKGAADGAPARVPAARPGAGPLGRGLEAVSRAPGREATSGGMPRPAAMAAAAPRA